MRRVQTAAETAKQAAEWISDLRIWAVEGGSGEALAPGDCDELATLIERLAEETK